MESPWLLSQFQPPKKPEKRNKSREIRLLVQSGITVKTVAERVGCSAGYVNSVLKRQKISLLKNMPVGYIFDYNARRLRFIKYATSHEGDVHVIFENEAGRQEGILLNDLIDEALNYAAE